LSEIEKKRHDKDFIERVGLYYETHDESAREVAKAFTIKEKTVESWITRKGWIKGRLRGQFAQLSAAMDKEKYARVISAMSEDGIIEKAMEMAGNDPKKAQYLIDELTVEQINIAALDNEAKWCVVRAQTLTKETKSLNQVGQYLAILSSAKSMIYGKSPDTNITLNFGDMDEAQMASMTEAELRKLKAAIEEKMIAQQSTTIEAEAVDVV